MKENVIIGKKIPAGTGLVQAADTVVGSQVEYDKLMNPDTEEVVAEEVVAEEVVVEATETSVKE